MECGLAMFLVVAMHFFVDTGAFSSGSCKARGFGYYPVCVPPKSSLVLGRLIPAIFQVYFERGGNDPMCRYPMDVLAGAEFDWITVSHPLTY